jgi:hypothetical protein
LSHHYYVPFRARRLLACLALLPLRDFKGAQLGSEEQRAQHVQINDKNYLFVKNKVAIFTHFFLSELNWQFSQECWWRGGFKVKLFSLLLFECSTRTRDKNAVFITRVFIT